MLTIVLARRLGLAGFAGYAVVASLLWLANVLTTFGTDLVLVRRIAATGAVDAWRAALVLQLLLSVPAVGAMWLLAPFAPWPATDGQVALRIVAVALFPLAATSVATAVMRGGAAAAAWAVAAGRAPALLRPAPVGVDDLAWIARSSLPIGLSGAVGMVVQRAPIVPAGALAGPAATAFLAAARHLADASTTGQVAFFSALLPELASERAAERTRRLSWRMSVAASALLAATMLAFGPGIVSLLYGAAYSPAGTALRILALGVVPSTAVTFRILELVAVRRERRALLGLGTGLGALAVASRRDPWRAPAVAGSAPQAAATASTEAATP